MVNTPQNKRDARVLDTPTERVIRAFGSVEAVAEATGVPPHRIYRWRQDGEKGGRDGRVPDESQGAILAAARRLGVRLRAADLIAMPATEGAR